MPKYVYPSFSTSFITSLFGSFILSHLTMFPLFRVRIPHFFPSKLHPNISTKDMRSSHKCIHLFFTLGEQLQIIHEQQTIQLLLLLSPSIACVYLSKYQRQRYHTQNKQQWRKTVSLKYPFLHINLPKIFTIRR